MIYLYIIFKCDIKKNIMTSIITADIIQSKKSGPRVWMRILKKELNKTGLSPKVWEIYRGDSFQMEVSKPAYALETAIRIKAALKSLKGVDVRMAIGIGTKEYNAARITESNGTAFIFSGEKFEMLKKEKQNLAVHTKSSDFNVEMNLYLKLALITMDKWTVNSAQAIRVALENPKLSQNELGKLLKIKQNAVSYRLKRACFDEIKELIEIYKIKLKKQL